MIYKLIKFNEFKEASPQLQAQLTNEASALGNILEQLNAFKTQILANMSRTSYQIDCARPLPSLFQRYALFSEIILLLMYKHMSHRSSKDSAFFSEIILLLMYKQMISLYKCTGMHALYFTFEKLQLLKLARRALLSFH